MHESRSKVVMAISTSHSQVAYVKTPYYAVHPYKAALRVTPIHPFVCPSVPYHSNLTTEYRAQRSKFQGKSRRNWQSNYQVTRRTAKRSVIS